MTGRAALALVFLAATAQAQPAPRPLTAAEQRMLDGTYLYLAAPDYCDPALPAAKLRSWVAGLIRQGGIAPEAAAEYLSQQQPRLRLIADAAFNGRRGKELCRSIYLLRETVPELQ